MNVHHVLFFCFLSALRDGNTRLVDATTFVRTEGDTIIVQCPFSFSGRKTFLCRDECEEKDILIETEGDRAERGRYGILYKKGTFPVSSTDLYVVIAQLTMSDSGRYWCGLERPYFPDSYWKFDIRVTQFFKKKGPTASASGSAAQSPRPHPPNEPALVPAEEAPKTLPVTTKQPEQQLTAETTAAAATVHSVKVSQPGYSLPLVVCITVVVLFAVVGFLLYKCKTGLNTRGQSDDRHTEVTTREKCEDCTSPSVHETSSDEDKIYCNL